MGRNNSFRISYIAAAFLIAVMSYQRASAVEIPPTPMAHYYGDADGNVSLNLSDIAQHNAYTSFRPCTYDTLQPQTGGQYWNTCDVDGNRSCNLSDIAILNSYTSFKSVALGGDPWVLENVNLSLSGNEANTWIPFNINLYMTYSGAPSGRPGISVIAEIDPTSPGHGQLSGRSCTPVGGTRDQLAPAGAQCALAVTITDWQAGQEGLGLTESGTYGFQVWGDGDGDLKIDFHIEEWPAMDIPLVTLSQTINFVTVNQPPEWTSTAPTTATEEALYTYNMTATDPESDAVTFQVNVVTDTCGGIVMGGLYSFIPGELDGGTTCVVGVQACDFTGSGGCTDQDTTVTIDESNQNPTITVDCPVGVGEDTATSCTISIVDADLPPQNFTCSLIPASPVEVTVGSGTSTMSYPVGTSTQDRRTQVIYLASEIGMAGPLTALALNVYSISGKTMNNFTIRMKHTDLNAFTSPYAWDGPSSGWTTVFQDNIAIATTGWNTFTLTTPFWYNGVQNLMIDISFNNSSPGLNSNVYAFSSGARRVVYYSTNSAYGDPLLWSGTSNPTPYSNTYVPNMLFSFDAPCTGAVLNGCDSIDIPAQGEIPSSVCKVSVSVSDDYVPPGTGQSYGLVGIVETNQAPTVTVNCPSNVGENTATTCALTAFDGDLPPQTYSCSVDASTTCTGVTLTSCTQVDVPPQGEGSNPRTCDVVINVEDDFSPPGSGQGSDTITLDDDNINPTITVDCPASVAEDTATSCTLTAADVDLPAQVLTCSLNASTTCAGASITDCTQVDVPAQGEAAVSCSVAVDIQDDYLPVHGTGQGGDTMDIDEVNQDPNIIVDCPANVGENTATTCALTVSDGDLPPQALSCTVDAASTCSGVTLTCTSATVPPQGEGPNPRTCDVIINVEDNFNPPGLAQGSDTITLDEENFALTWNPLPSDLTVDMNKPYTGVNGHGTDVDDPAPSLTCEKTSQTCSFAVTVSGSGSGEVDCNFNFTPSGTPEQCEVDVEVTDGMTETVTDTVAINTVSVWYVDDTATGANNGTSWTDAFNILQDAVDAASAGDMIWVAEGTYTRRSGDHDPVLTMKQGVLIFGGFAGTESSLSERSDPFDYETVLNGENQSYHVIIGSSYATIDGFSVINGNAEYIIFNPYGPYPRYYCDCYSCCEGGGMFNAGVNNLYISNCIFKQNSAARHGGAMININSSPVINNSIFSQNSSSGCYEWGMPHVTYGGAISNEGGSSPYIYNSVIMGNNAIYGSGGGIFNGGGSTSLTNCLITLNSAFAFGGGVYNQGGFPSIYNCTFSGNHVEVTSGRAIHNRNSPALISNNILWGGTGYVGGGEIGHSGAAYPTVTYSDVEGGYPGTGNINADPLFMGDLLGPGTWTADPVYNPGLFITTLTDDTQSWAPSALKRRFINPDTTSPFALYLILDNTSTTITVRGNITSGITMGDSYKLMDYHIGSTSPCKDTGTSTGAPPDDFDGNPRPSCSGYDMGAYEYQCP